MRLLSLLLVFVLASPAMALEDPPEPTPGGEVRVPLATYTQMLAQLDKEPRRAPADYAIGRSALAVTVSESQDRFTAEVEATVLIQTFEDEWTLVPILPPGAALKSATVDGRPVQLVQGADGLAWSTATAGTVTLRLRYGVDARESLAGFVLPLPVPLAAATELSLSFPATGVDLAVLPSADLRSVEEGNTTRITATVPATSSLLVSWRAPSKLPYAISRALYSGALKEDALVWTADFQVEVFGGGRTTLPLMPSGVTLSDIRVDGEAATVLEQDGQFATVLQGRGLHEVQVEFQVAVISGEGPPQARLLIPRIPVSRFDLTLPGRKDVSVTPGANVVTSESDDQTKATVFVPMSDSVVFTWTEAVPEALRIQVRANASLYHAVHAEEGVLLGWGTVVYEITHGETSLLELEIPGDTQVNRILAPGGGVSDWAVADSEVEGRKTITVFLERPVAGEFLLEVFYERLLDGGADTEDAIAVPLLNAINVHRQRGMVALLSGQELALEPVAEEGLSRVGENQLPAFVRNRIAMTVAHTYKYTEPGPRLRVAPAVPERKQGKFDAQVDTLISLGEVTMKGAATIEVDVKSGSIVDLTLRLPGGVNILGVSGPSLRSHEEREVENGQAIALEFTREMEGRFRVEVSYERIMDSAAAEAVVPTISVPAAEVEHGRIAVEALTAVEVRAAAVENLSSLDINELPQQLVLKTTNPILLAYRYVNATPPFKLALKITRHKEIDVQVAAIERAAYSSLFTRDGLAVTTARLTVRNSRRQFLRLALPPESQVWSVFVDGKPEKPAYASDGANGSGEAVLVKMINSAEGFPVDIVYATPVAALDHLGTLESRLPRPDMVVTHTRWDVFLPVGPNYLTPDSTMDLLEERAMVDPRLYATEAVARAADGYQMQFGQPLRITVPAQGIRFAFEKLYADQSPEEAAFSIRYVSENANYAGLLLSAGGVVLLWIGIAAIASPRIGLPRKGIVAVLAW
ncbi:MAG: hypothetical protein OEM59_12940, partial [Rhodospirillales bacterium]|nr:hypothetical protein [Rhodospirillales bacterium]